MKSKTAAPAPQTIDEYIAVFPGEVRAILQKVRTTIQKAAPAATEAIKYQLPTFVLHGNLVHFGAFKQHIGFYAMPTGNARFGAELSAYEGGKGSVRFPLNRPVPFGLISKIVRFRVQENIARAATKQRTTR